MAGKPRAGAVRKSGKGPSKGTGGLGRRALEGKGPTPKAEDREWHPAGKAKIRREKLAAMGKLNRNNKDGQRKAAPKRSKAADDTEIVTGRNSVLEALRAKIPATALYIATRIEMDDRVKEMLAIATQRGIPILEVMKPELDRMGGYDSVHQGVAVKVPPYNYAHPNDLLEAAFEANKTPLFVALDGITDPRNLGAIIRSTAAFGGNGIILPQRRSVGVTAAAWKTSAGAAARLPVSMAANLTATIKSFKDQGVFVIGLDGGGDTMLPGLELADRPLLIVVGNEGKGLSKLVTDNCDAIVSIPISSSTESLNAGIAASVALYEVARLRSASV
ncbi:23S rRNA (guanosine(2251)-2'-O)-methyltransferase RlmB [Aurantimicrobium sp. MWH-Uga1]|uniref:23S rRNA (guanosine(2251)-2'-O)-methyltransferase RlmB n=1 Tax=Aurantimicrobium sp. MWH-Uga1 TaxID=2079575 RepID=UPI000DED44E4|nr:23S rRNA (guanosine(2251)-2'-O)-methyltransferase RlmB [Aurantimicrobium sp. MWH-Uga1]AXE54001.1 Putative TrmH family tRNA/rRNA methyltransferase [Aurantimicrobium sp. MWH-Uga1]